MMVYDVDGRQGGSVHALEDPPQVFRTWNGRFVARDEDLVSALDVGFGHGVHVIRGVGRMKNAGVVGTLFFGFAGGYDGPSQDNNQEFNRCPFKRGCNL